MTVIVLKNSNVARKRPDPGALADGEVAININSAEPGLFFKSSSGSLVKAGPTYVGTAPPNTNPAGFAGNTIGELWADSTYASSGFFPLNIYTSAGWKPASTPSTLDGRTNSNSTVLGVGATTTNDKNIAIGYQAGNSTSTFQSAVAIGYQAGKTAEGTLGSVYIGYRAGANMTGNSHNDEVFIGGQAGENAFGQGSATGSIGIGTRALQNTRSSSCTAVGYQALMNQSTGSNNTACGYQALMGLTTGTQNTAFGTNALKNITTGAGNQAFGYQAGFDLTGGSSNNICFGQNSGPTGASNNNVCLGNNAGKGATGNGNIFIGNNSGMDAGAVNNVVVIGPFTGSLSGLDGGVLLAAYDGTKVLQFNSNGAMMVSGDYGQPGQPLISGGNGGAASWNGSGGAFGEFSAQSKTFTVRNGLIVAIS